MGIPVLHILEGVVPRKAEGAPFDRPLDMIVTFVSSRGDQRHFSYGELTMVDDGDPVLLAFHRAELLPAKQPAGEAYTWNRNRGSLRGLRLVCPAEPNTERYLDDVTRIVLTTPSTSGELPVARRGERCSADSIMVLRNGTTAPLRLDGVERASVAGWIRTGHGRGYKGIVSASGYDLRSLLRRNFPDAGPERFFLFVACDGYRAIFSGREIFVTAAGGRMMLIEEIDGEPPRGGPSLGPVSDYFIDRMVRSVMYVIMLEPPAGTGDPR